MITFKKDNIPDLDFKKAIKKPIAIRCIQIDKPFKVESSAINVWATPTPMFLNTVESVSFFNVNYQSIFA